MDVGTRGTGGVDVRTQGVWGVAQGTQGVGGVARGTQGVGGVDAETLGLGMWTWKRSMWGHRHRDGRAWGGMYVGRQSSQVQKWP